MTIFLFWCGKIFKILDVIFPFRNKEICSFRERVMIYIALHLCILVSSYCLYSLRRELFKFVTIKNRSNRDAQFLWQNLSDIRSASERVVRMATSLKHYVQEKLQEDTQPTLPLRILASKKNQYESMRDGHCPKSHLAAQHPLHVPVVQFNTSQL